MKNNKRKIRYLVLILLLLFISIGYAYLNSTLNITGSSTINNPTWDIHWENVEVKTGSVSAQTPIIDTNKTTVNYSVTLTIPGEYYEFTVDAVNAGTIDGMISVVSNKLNGTDITTLPNYLEYKVSYDDGIDIAPNHLLEANSSEKYKVYVGYKKDINVSDIPATQQTLNFSFSVTYVQRDTTFVPVPHPQTVYTANFWDGSVYTVNNGTNTTVVWIGKSIPNGITLYQTPDLAMEALKQKIDSEEEEDVPFFLKHIVINNIVTDSYVGFVVTPKMVQNNPGMTAGTYYIKGKKTYELIEGNWQCISEYDDGNGNCLDPEYEANKSTLLSAFGITYCTDYSSSFLCRISGLDIEIISNGEVFVHNDIARCRVREYGYSGCFYYS